MVACGPPGEEKARGSNLVVGVPLIVTVKFSYQDLWLNMREIASRSPLVGCPSSSLRLTQRRTRGWTGPFPRIVFTRHVCDSAQNKWISFLRACRHPWHELLFVVVWISTRWSAHSQDQFVVFALAAHYCLSETSLTTRHNLNGQHCQRNFPCVQRLHGIAILVPVGYWK